MLSESKHPVCDRKVTGVWLDYRTGNASFLAKTLNDYFSFVPCILPIVEAQTDKDLWTDPNISGLFYYGWTMDMAARASFLRVIELSSALILTSIIILHRFIHLMWYSTWFITYLLSKTYNI